MTTPAYRWFTKSKTFARFNTTTGIVSIWANSIAGYMWGDVILTLQHLKRLGLTEIPESTARELFPEAFK